MKKLQKTITKKASFSKFLLLLWPFYQLSQIPFSRIYLLDLVVILAVILQSTKLKRNHPFSKVLLVFLTSATVSFLVALVSGTSSLTAFLYLARLFLYSSLLFVSLPKKAPSILHVSFFIVPVLGLLQYILLPDLRLLKLIGYDDHYFRLTSPFLDPNYTGAILAFISLYSIRNIKKTSNKILLILSLSALALTFSRISYLALFIGLVYLSISRWKEKGSLRIALTSIVLLASLVALAPKPFGEGVNLTRIFSVTSRIGNLQKGFQLFISNPITGVGYNTLPFSVSNHSGAGLDNSFVFILATTGIIGFTSFVYLLYKVWLSVLDPYLKAAFLSLVIHSLANNTLFYAPVTILVFLFLNLNARNLPSQSSQLCCPPNQSLQT